MRVEQEFQLTPAAIRALAPALKRSNIGWIELNEYMRGEGWCIWNIGGVGYVFTLINQDNEIEVLLAGGERAKDCVPYWEAAMLAHPSHKGLTVRVDGRKGWRRLLAHWDCDADGILTKRIG